DLAIASSTSSDSESTLVNPVNIASIGFPPHTSLVATGISGFCGVQLKILTVPPSWASSDPSPLSSPPPPHALRNKARDAATAIAPFRNGAFISNPPRSGQR